MGIKNAIVCFYPMARFPDWKGGGGWPCSRRNEKNAVAEIDALEMLGGWAYALVVWTLCS